VSDTLKRSQKRFLGQVTSFLHIFSQPVKQAEDFTGTFVDQRFKGGCVATLQFFNELGLSLGPYVSYGCRSNLL
jgi:hypothetical protein